MPVFSLFSKRQRQLRGENADVYQYDKIPYKLRVQIVHILKETLGETSPHSPHWGPNRAYKEIVNILRKEYGVFTIAVTKRASCEDDELFDFILHEKDFEKALDAVEISINAINAYTRNYNYLNKSNSSEIANGAIEEINFRFKENAVGYEFSGKIIIRIDSEFIHKEVVKEALVILSDPNFSGSQQEFLSAHDHYRNGKYKECLVDCLKSFESLMKSIFDRRKWAYNKSDPASKLIAVCFDKSLVPSYWQTNFGAIRTLLESGIPTVRNKTAGHGQGAQVVAVPREIAAYALHLTASTLVFLSEADKNLP